MRIAELKGRRLVDRATARRLGRIVDVFVDGTRARIVAVELATPGREDCVCIPAEWITGIGSCALMVARRSGGELAEVVPATELRARPHRLAWLAESQE
jgi:sporulation protein YlmC with PRC-barrel domain